MNSKNTSSGLTTTAEMLPLRSAGSFFCRASNLSWERVVTVTCRHRYHGSCSGTSKGTSTRPGQFQSWAPLSLSAFSSLTKDKHLYGRVIDYMTCFFAFRLFYSVCICYLQGAVFMSGQDTEPATLLTIHLPSRIRPPNTEEGAVGVMRWVANTRLSG